MKAFRADILNDEAMPTNEVIETLAENFVDVTGAQHVEVVTDRKASGGWVIHINVNGVCLLRICRIQNLEVRLS